MYNLFSLTFALHLEKVFFIAKIKLTKFIEIEKLSGSTLGGKKFKTLVNILNKKTSKASEFQQG